MDNHGVKIEYDTKGVARVTLAKPDIHNAFDEQMISQLRRVFLELSEDQNTRIVILQAEGRSFSAGADLNWMKRMAQFDYEENVDDAKALASMLSALNSLPQLTIAKIQGAAFGGAVGLVSCCDIAIASTRAKFCLSEVKLGLIPAVISPYVIEAMGKRSARRYFQTAEIFDADRALALGLLSECVSEDLLEECVISIVNNCLNNGPHAMKAAKQLVFEVAGRKIDQNVMQDTSEAIAAIRVSDEGQEGLGAFLEKRKPNFGGQ